MKRTLTVLLILTALSFSASGQGSSVFPYTTPLWRTFLDGTTAEFQADTDSLTFFQILDLDGGVPIFNVDTTNERVGIGTASPDVTLQIIGSIKIGDDNTNYSITNSEGDTWWVGTGGLIFGSLYVPGVDVVVSTGDANPHEVKDDGTTSANDGWSAGALNEMTFPSGGDEHYITVSKAGIYKGDWGVSAHTGGGGATEIHGGMMVDDVAQRNDGEGHTHVSTLNDAQDLGSPVMLELTAGTEEVSLWVSADNSQDVHIEHGTMSLMLVAGLGTIAPENIIYAGENVIYAAEQVVYP